MSGREVKECNKHGAQIIDEELADREAYEGIKQLRYDYCAVIDAHSNQRISLRHARKINVQKTRQQQ